MRLLRHPDAIDLHSEMGGERVISGRAVHLDHLAEGSVLSVNMYDEREAVVRGVLGEITFAGPRESGTYDEYRLLPRGEIARHGVVESDTGLQGIDEAHISDTTGESLAATLARVVEQFEDDGTIA